jgi:hypothetical protein
VRDIFNEKGELIIPLSGRVKVPRGVVQKKGSAIVVNEAYCPNGHSLISDVEIEGERGIHFIYTDESGSKRTDIVISPVVRKCKKKVLKGEPFRKDETVRILCPHCGTELPVLFNCECGAPIYLFYIGRDLDYNFGQSFCSRIGCVKASQLRFSKDVLKEFESEYSF